LVELSKYLFYIMQKGALMYEMLTGATPFYSKDKTLMFRNRIE